MKSKKLIYVRVVKANGGKAIVRGLGDEEMTPSKLCAVLERHGFMQETDDEWVDIVSPSADLYGLYDNLEAFQSVFPYALFFDEKHVICQIQGTPYAKAKDIPAAMYKAHGIWNKAGRPIGGVTVEDALADVLDEINAKRG